jgi:hypothetical protein
MAYPSWRGVFGALYNVVGYYIGAIGELHLMCVRYQITLITYLSLYLDHVWHWPSHNRLVLENSYNNSMCPLANCDGIHLVHARISEMALCQQ